jgi:hypothetical protein
MPSQKSPNSTDISVLPAYNWLKYSANEINSEGAFDVGFGLTYRRQFHPFFQFAIGVNYRKYYGTIDFNGMRDSVHMIDPAENDLYWFYQIFNHSEAQTLTRIEPNVRLEFLFPLSFTVDFIAGAGLGFGINLTETNRMTNGSYRRYTWYYENHNTLENVQGLGLGTYADFLNPLSGQAFKHSLFALGGIGFRFRILPNLQILTLLNIQHSLLNVQAKQDIFIHHWSYSGIARSDIPQGVRAISAGLELSLGFRFPRVEKPKTPQKIRSAHCP